MAKKAILALAAGGILVGLGYGHVLGNQGNIVCGFLGVALLFVAVALGIESISQAVQRHIARRRN